MHIYDKEFTQTELPMTKQEIRAISIAKLMLKPNSILIDVGAGAVDAASTFFSSLQPVNTNADAIAVIANKFFNFMFFPCCE